MSSIFRERWELRRQFSDNVDRIMRRLRQVAFRASDDDAVRAQAEDFDNWGDWQTFSERDATRREILLTALASARPLRGLGRDVFGDGAIFPRSLNLNCCRCSPVLSN